LTTRSFKLATRTTNTVKQISY